MLQAAQKASDERRAAAEKRLKDSELRCEALEEEYTKYRKNQRRREDGGVFAGFIPFFVFFSVFVCLFAALYPSQKMLL